MISSLTHAYKRAERYDEAFQRGEELVGIRRKLDPELKDSKTVIALKNLAVFYEVDGQKKKADVLRAELPASQAVESPHE